MIDITNISDMTDEQLKELLTSAAGQISDLEAERDSFKEENEQLKTESQKLNTELSNTKKLNFTLARQVDTSGTKASVEDTLHAMFGRKE